jgi:chorismate mutase
MSSPARTDATPLDRPFSVDADRSLADLRAELDRIDDGIHDLLMRRAGVVEQVAAMAARGKVPFRPGREAQILRRLLLRHAGPLPARAIPRLWRELFAATTAMQGPFAVAVCEQDPAQGMAAIAREHFGALTPTRVHRTPAQTLAEIGNGAATLAVLPLPAEEEPAAAAWWTSLLHRDETRLHVVARLPFWAARPEGAPRAQALVVSAAAPDPSGQDRALIGAELPPEMSRARLQTAIAGAGLAAETVLLRRDPSGQDARCLVDAKGFVAEDDPRLAALGAALGARPTVLGNYAVPWDAAP